MKPSLKVERCTGWCRFRRVAVIKDVAAFAGGGGDDDGIASDGGGSAISGDAEPRDDLAVLRGGEFNSVGTSAGGDVDL